MPAQPELSLSKRPTEIDVEGPALAETVSAIEKAGGTVFQIEMSRGSKTTTFSRHRGGWHLRIRWRPGAQYGPWPLPKAPESEE